MADAGEYDATKIVLFARSATAGDDQQYDAGRLEDLEVGDVLEPPVWLAINPGEVAGTLLQWAWTGPREPNAYAVYRGGVLLTYVFNSNGTLPAPIELSDNGVADCTTNTYTLIALDADITGLTINSIDDSSVASLPMQGDSFCQRRPHAKAPPRGPLPEPVPARRGGFETLRPGTLERIRITQ